MGRSAIIVDDDTHQKILFSHCWPGLYLLIVLDHGLTPHITVATGMDASRNMEAFLAKKLSPYL